MASVWRLHLCVCIWYACSLATTIPQRDDTRMEELSCSRYFPVLTDHQEDTHDFLFIITSPEEEKIVNDLRALFSEDITNQRINVNIIHSTDVTQRTMIHCAPMKKDRTCLVSPPVEPSRISTTFPKHLPFQLSSLAEFVNTQATLFRHPMDGTLTSFGSYVEQLKRELFTITQSREECSKIPFASIVHDPLLFVQEYWLKQRPVIVEGFPLHLCEGILTTNESTSLSSSRCLLELLLSQYGEKSVGVKLSPSTDFEGTIHTSPIHTLSLPFSLYFSLTASLPRIQKGIDKLSNWGMADTQHVPPTVLAKMESPHLVVVRAKHEDMKLGLVLDLIVQGANKRLQQQQQIYTSVNNNSLHTAFTTANAYVEYLPLTSLPNLLPRVLPVDTLPSLLGFPNNGLGFDQQCDNPHRQCLNATNDNSSSRILEKLPSLLKGGKAHFWLGDGRTVGKLHFDQFDNLLVQLVGSKKFYLLDPTQNDRLREGHMREALLGAKVTYSQQTDHHHQEHEDEDDDEDEMDNSKTTVLTPEEAILRPYHDVRVSVTHFKKHTLTESTSMVHSPVTMDFDRVLPTDLPHMECHVHAGEMLFVPSFWWHEVQSSPGDLVSATTPTTTTSKTETNTGSDDDHHYRMQYNAAINIWYTPLFEKNFPCPLCKKFLNLKVYQKELETLHQFTSKH